MSNALLCFISMVFVVHDVASEDEGWGIVSGGLLAPVTDDFFGDGEPGAEVKVTVRVAGPVFGPVRSVVIGIAGL